MADSVQLLRQWTVLRTLAARRHGATLRELADESGVSEKTITRDLNLLRRLAFPISERVSDHGRKHWVMTDAGGLPSLSFTLEEAAALYLGRQCLERLAQLPGRIGPEYDAVTVERRFQAFGNAIIHAQSSASDRPLMGLSAAPNFG